MVYWKYFKIIVLMRDGSKKSFTHKSLNHYNRFLVTEVYLNCNRLYGGYNWTTFVVVEGW